MGISKRIGLQMQCGLHIKGLEEADDVSILLFLFVFFACLILNYGHVYTGLARNFLKMSLSRLWDM